MKLPFTLIGVLFLILFSGRAYAIDSMRLVVEHYSDMALAKYEDSLMGALRLDSSIRDFLFSPSAESLEVARRSWKLSRIPYLQSEVYRFGNSVVDDWEGRVNGWPLDEGFIDYVDSSGLSSENEFSGANIIGNERLLMNGEVLDISDITAELLSGTLHELQGIESNVASGYHAIEFLLWGQDLHGTGAGSGLRPYSDFSLGGCIVGSCDRRRAYLLSASELLVLDLREMVANWGAGGSARVALEELPSLDGIGVILTGMGSLSYGELAGERMRLGLLLGDPEEEQDCFSDNTHNAHYYDGLGIRNVYLGEYRRLDGSVLRGASLSSLVSELDYDLDVEFRSRLDYTLSALGAIVSRAETIESYDQMIARGNESGNLVIELAIGSLIEQALLVERVGDLFGLGELSLEGSESLDDPHAIFQ